MSFLNNRHVKGARKSPIYRLLQVLPTPARPWLLALEAAHQVRERRMERGFSRREHQLQRELDRARGRKRGGMGLGRMVFAAGLTFLASQLTKSQQKGQVRSTPLMKSTEREKTTSGK
jgi:hypothetical protein